MRLQNYIDIGAALAEDCSFRLNPEFTYTDIDTFVDSPYGRLCYFDGTGNRIDTNSVHEFIQQTGVFTISFKAKRDSESNTDMVVHGIDAGGGFMVYFNSGQYIYINIYNGASVILAAGLPTTAVDTSEWHSYSIIGDGTSAYLYIDGVARGKFGDFTSANFGGSQATNTNISNTLFPPTGLYANVVIDDRTWSTEEITAYHENRTFDYQKDIHALWPLDNQDNVIDSSFKALNGDSNAGFDCTKVGEFKKYPYFAGTATTSYRIPFAMAYSTLAIEFKCIIDADETQGPLIGFSNSTNCQFLNGSGTPVGINLGTPDVFVDDVQIVGCTQDQLHTAIVDGQPHKVRFEGINGHVQFTSPNDCEFFGHAFSTAEQYWTRGFLYDIGIDFLNNGTYDHFYPLDEVNGLSDTVGGGADLTTRGTTVNWVETEIQSLSEGYNDRLTAKSLTFSGVEYMTLDAAAATTLNGLDAVTVTAWVKNDSGGTILGLWNDAEEKLHITVNANGTLQAMITTTDGSGTSTLNSNIKIADNEWHHIAVAIDLANDECSFYIDGTLDNLSPHTIGRDSSFVSGGVASYLASNGSTHYTGELSDVRIYEKALSFSEVKESSVKTLENIPSYDVVYWHVTLSSSWTNTGNTDGGLLYSTQTAVSSVYYCEAGGKLYVGNTTSVFEYNLTDSDITTISFVQSQAIGYVIDLHFSNDGTKMFTCEYSYRDNRLKEYTLSTPYDITSATFQNDIDQDFLTNTEYGNDGPASATVSPDGKYVVVAFENWSSGVWRWAVLELATAWSLASVTELYNEPFNYQTGVNRGILQSNPDGTQIFAPYDAGGGFLETWTTSGWGSDPSTFSTDGDVAFNVDPGDKFCFNADGTKFFWYDSDAGARVLKAYNTDASV